MFDVKLLKKWSILIFIAGNPNIIVMVLCLMVGCSNRTGKRSKNDREIVNFYRVTRVITNHGEFVEELSAKRRRLWISAISKADITEKKA